MNTFLRRLKYYGIGFGIGLIFVFVIFKQKGCSWTPGNRVKDAVFNRILVVDSLDSAFLVNRKLSQEDLRKLIQNASISFSESDIKSKRKTYVLFGELPNGNTQKFLLTLHDQDFLVEVDFLHDSPAKFQRHKGNVRPFLYKDQKNWFHGDWVQYAKEGFTGGDSPEKLTKLFFKHGRIFIMSDVTEQTKPIHQLIIPYEGKDLMISAFYFQEKIEVQAMDYKTP